MLLVSRGVAHIPNTYVPAGTTVVRTSAPPNGMAVPVSDANLTLGNTANGTDNTTAIQALLNLNQSGGSLLLIVDGAYTVQGLTVNSNTHVLGLPGCGFKRKSGTFVPLLANANQSYGSGGGSEKTLGSFGNTHIRLAGLTLNCNAGNVTSLSYSGQPDLRVVAVQMFGVQFLAIEDCLALDTPAYGFHAANVQYLRVRGCQLLLTSVTVNPDGRDGFHINGPADQCWLDDCSFMAGDDSVALNANDGNRADILPTSGSGQFPYPGPITNVWIQNLHLNGSARGVRLLSSDQLIDQVTIRGVTGALAGSSALMFSTFLASSVEDGNNPEAGAGNIGTVTIDGWDVTIGDNGGNSWQSPILLYAGFAALRVKGLRLRPDGNNTRPTVQIVSGTAYDTLDVELDVVDTDGANRTREIISDSGNGGVARVRGTMQRPGLAAVAIPAFQKDGGTLAFLRTDLEWDASTHSVVVNAGSITTVQMSGIHSHASGGGALNLASGITVNNFGCGDLLAVVNSDGSGTITNTIPTGSYAEAAAPMIAHITAYWKMGEAAGNPRVDSVHSLSLAETNGTVAQAAGEIGNAASFSGTGSNSDNVAYLSMADNADVSGGSGSYFVLCRFYPTLTSPPNGCPIASKREGGSGPNNIEWLLQLQGAGTPDLYFYHGNAAGGLNFVSGGAVNLNAWNHAVCYVDTTNNLVAISLNGGSFVTASRTYTGTDDSGASLFVGAWDGEMGLGGRVNALGVGKGYVPTSTDVAAFFNGGSGSNLGF